jgi:copper oxidase (laccase) domain-containing protein
VSLDIVRTGVLDGVPHGFFGRSGGVSTGAVASLNCGLGSGDDRHAVETNRRLAADATLPGAPLASVHQVHSPTAVIVHEAVPIVHRSSWLIAKPASSAPPTPAGEERPPGSPIRPSPR